MREAMFYEKQPNGSVRCKLCRFFCTIAPGARGNCRVRENRDGILYSMVYGKVCAEHADPIEKKPLFHVLPGSRSYSIATEGCNFHCRHCQNFTISQPAAQAGFPQPLQQPQAIIKKALAANCQSISYTYTEPTIFFEFAYDTARLARDAALLHIFVSNGYISKEALAAIAPVLDAANIDLKGFSELFYRSVTNARLSEVLDSLVEYRKQGVWIEITTLVIPGLNDSDDDLRGIASFIARNLGVDTPWHVSRFWPKYLLTDCQPTPVETLRRARDIGRAEGLRYVYEGNVPGNGGENTRCPSCSSLLIERSGFAVISNRLQNSACPGCGTIIAGIGL